MEFSVCEATPELLEKIWNYNIAKNPDEPEWVRWKSEYIGYNSSGMAKTFMVLADGEPVGEGTLILSPDCKAVSERIDLADGKTIANVNALRIRKEYEGMGHISRMMKLMEEYAKSVGITKLTIGVEAAEARNLAIYLHWGYTDFVRSEGEDGALVLYYGKNI